MQITKNAGNFVRNIAYDAMKREMDWPYRMDHASVMEQYGQKPKK